MTALICLVIVYHLNSFKCCGPYSRLLVCEIELLCNVETTLVGELLRLCGVAIIVGLVHLIPLFVSILFYSCSFAQAMPELRGPALLATVTTLTSLGFLMIGYDNGLLGGLGMFEFLPC